MVIFSMDQISAFVISCRFDAGNGRFVTVREDVLLQLLRVTLGDGHFFKVGFQQGFTQADLDVVADAKK